MAGIAAAAMTMRPVGGAAGADIVRFPVERLSRAGISQSDLSSGQAFQGDTASADQPPPRAEASGRDIPAGFLTQILAQSNSAEPLASTRLTAAGAYGRVPQGPAEPQSATMDIEMPGAPPLLSSGRTLDLVV